MIYLVRSFRQDKDTSSNGNPPLSEEGVQFGKKLKLRNNRQLGKKFRRLFLYF